MNSASVSSPTRTIQSLNQVAVQHFHHCNLSEANKCFLSAIKIMKRLSTTEDAPATAAVDMFKAHEFLAAAGEGCRSALPATNDERPKSDPTTEILSPLSLCGSDFVIVVDAMAPEDLLERYAWIGYTLIFNLAVTIHHQSIDARKVEQESMECDGAVQEQTSVQLYEQAKGLYQCVYDGVTTHEYPQQPHSKDAQMKQMILGQRLMLSVLHNMGLLFSGNCGGETSSAESCPSFRCFQLVFATLHSLRDYFGMEPSDFPADFDLELVIATALDRLSIGSDNSGSTSPITTTAPCA